MNVCQFQLLLTLIFAVISCTIAVRLDTIWPFGFLDLEPTTTEPTPPPPPRREMEIVLQEDDALATLEALERETFRQVTEHELLQPDARHYTPSKCCKIGKKVADKGFYCNIDLMQVEKKNNNVYRRKMKFQGVDSGLVDAIYKMLMTKVEKCYPNKAASSMFSKCCEWQQQISVDMDNCKFLESRDARRDCKQRVRAREG